MTDMSAEIEDERMKYEDEMRWPCCWYKNGHCWYWPDKPRCNDRTCAAIAEVLYPSV